MVGGSVPPSLGGRDTIVVGLSELRRIREMNTAGWTITAEAGCTLGDLQRTAGAADRAFGIDLGARDIAQLGGLIATNAGGMSVLRYGNMREQVLGLEVVLPDGTLWQGLRGLRKDNSGYDLKHLFIGSEGTLGIITAATLRLHPPERFSTTALLAVRDVGSINNIVDQLLAAGDVSALELMPAFGIEVACANVLGCVPPICLVNEWYVQVRFAGVEDMTGRAVAITTSLLEQALVTDGIIAASPSQERSLWDIRDSFSQAHRHLGVSFRFDLSVPVDRIPSLLETLRRRISRVLPNARLFAFGHLGDGNLHFSACEPSDSDRAAFVALKPVIEEAVHATCWDAGGSISAEHGVGRLHALEIQDQKSDVEIQLQRRVKEVFDPEERFNPGVLFPSTAGKDALSSPAAQRIH